MTQTLMRDWTETIGERCAQTSEFRGELVKILAQELKPVGVVYSMQDGYVGQLVTKGIPHGTALYTT